MNNERQYNAFHDLFLNTLPDISYITRKCDKQYYHNYHNMIIILR